MENRGTSSGHSLRAADRILLTGDPGGTAAASATESSRISSLGPFEIEFLQVLEVDESGRITAGIQFDAPLVRGQRSQD